MSCDGWVLVRRLGGGREKNKYRIKVFPVRMQKGRFVDRRSTRRSSFYDRQRIPYSSRRDLSRLCCSYELLPALVLIPSLAIAKLQALGVIKLKAERDAQGGRQRKPCKRQLFLHRTNRVCCSVLHRVQPFNWLVPGLPSNSILFVCKIMISIRTTYVLGTWGSVYVLEVSSITLVSMYPGEATMNPHLTSRQ